MAVQKRRCVEHRAIEWAPSVHVEIAPLPHVQTESHRPGMAFQVHLTFSACHRPSCIRLPHIGCLRSGLGIRACPPVHHTCPGAAPEIPASRRVGLWISSACLFLHRHTAAVMSASAVCDPPLFLYASDISSKSGKSSKIILSTVMLSASDNFTPVTRQ